MQNTHNYNTIQAAHDKIVDTQRHFVFLDRISFVPLDVFDAHSGFDASPLFHTQDAGISDLLTRYWHAE